MLPKNFLIIILYKPFHLKFILVNIFPNKDLAESLQNITSHKLIICGINKLSQKTVSLDHPLLILFYFVSKKQFYLLVLTSVED